MNQQPGPGGVYAATHHASVRTICGDHAPPVFSRGDQFLNVDRWLDKAFAHQMFIWAAAHPEETPSDSDIWAWVLACNVAPIPQRAIFIASTPDELDWSMARARTGGAYHEGLHTLLSRRHRLRFEEVVEQVRDLWGQADWSGKLGSFVQEMHGYIEDVRIENRGNDRFPGIYPSMCDLQDFVLVMEEDGLRDARAHHQSTVQEVQQHNAQVPEAEQLPEPPEPEHWTELSTMLCAFRDIGLGYLKTTQAQKSLERYRSTHPDVLQAVEAGFLAPFVEMAQALSELDSLGSLWLTMRVVVAIQQESETEDSEEQEVAKRLVDQIETGASPVPGVLDGNSALMQALYAEVQAQKSELPEGSQFWRPYNPSADVQAPVGALVEREPLDLSELNARASQLMEQVYADVSYLRARLHQVLRASAHTGVEHGTLRGTQLSERMLVDTRLSLMMGDMPKHAFCDIEEEIDTSAAAAVVLDQSSSMESWLALATRILLTLTEPLSAMRSWDGQPFPVFACGIRHAPMTWEEWCAIERDAPEGWKEHFHRVHPVVYDVFKDFDEPLSSVLWRFAATRADGGTPMSDGIQLALQKLRTRREAHRLLFVVTDGAPTGQHARVIRHQIMQSREEGIHIIGVGIGRPAHSVMSLFDDHVWTESEEQLPEALIWKLNELLDFRKFQMVG